MKKYKKRFGDRKDARRIRNITGMNQIGLDIMPNRIDRYCYINQKMDLTELLKYVEKKKSEGSELTLFHCFVTAIGKTIYNRPKINYFIANRHVYEHDDITLSFVAKVSFEDHAEEMMIMVPIKENDNINTISKYIKEKVNKVRSENNTKEGANSAIDIVGKLPNIIRIPLMGILKFLDRIGKLPSFLIEDNLYYSTMILSNLGSIECGAINHHMVDFGTCSSIATIGTIENKEIIDKNGKREVRKICEFGITIDEMVADGFYFAKSLKLIQYYFDHPEKLEEKISTKDEVDIRK